MTRANAPRTVGELPVPTRVRPENSLAALIGDSVLLSRRLVLGFVRDRLTASQALVLPALTLIMFRIVLGDSVTSATGVPSIYGYVAMITLVGAMSGATVSALHLKRELREGFASRVQTLPVHRAAPLLGRLIADAARVVVTTLFIVAVGFALGFRFHEGFLAAAAFVLLPVLFGMGFTVFVSSLATRRTELPIVEAVGLVTTLLMFFNTGFVPVYAYPTWLQSIVANQPMSCAIDAMKALALGGPIAVPLTKTLAWTLGMVIVFAFPAIRGYRRYCEYA